MDTVGASRSNPITFEVIGEIGAGSVFQEEVGKKQAVRIMTGAMIPKGCDAVVMLELANEYEVNGVAYFDLKRSSKAGENISFTGEDTKKVRYWHQRELL